MYRILWSRFAKKFYIFCAILVAIFTLMNWVVMPWYVHDGGTVTVPDVVGMQSAAAKSALDTAGLQFELGGTKSSKLAPNTILAQNPEAGTTVKHGRRIYMIVSGGTEKIQVPNLIGHSQREAQFMLERLGFRLGSVASDSSSEYPLNVVMSQSVQPGNMSTTGSAVSIVVSSGPVESGEVSVPNLVGRPLSEAQKLILNANLLLGNITFQPSRKLVPNTVLEQYPRAKDVVPKGTAVNLYVSSVQSQSSGPEN
jgi:eukaryotic-like serine/threonine-protein kinase